MIHRYKDTCIGGQADKIPRSGRSYLLIPGVIALM